MKRVVKNQNLNWIQHALHRPETYIGSVENYEKSTFLAQENEEGKLTIRKKDVLYNDAFHRIHIEIMSNSVDNKWQSEELGINMKIIKYELNLEEGYASVYNDGAHIPVEINSYEYTDPNTNKITTNDMYPAELYFGHWLSGTNYDDNLDRKKSGRNGMGAKATNIFSKSFIVECADPDNHLLLNLKYSKNRSIISKPKIIKYKGTTGYTKVTWYPDFSKFGIKGYTDDWKNILLKDCIDAAMITGLNVTFNGVSVASKSLLSYSKLYIKDKNLKFLSVINTPEMDVVVQENPYNEVNENSFTHITFVNGIYTPKGGVHLTKYKDVILDAVRNILNSKPVKKSEEKINYTRKNLEPFFTIFVRYEANRPVFESQSKLELKAPSPVLSKKFKDTVINEVAKKISKWPCIEILKMRMESMQMSKVIRKGESVSGRISLGSKAEDANFAGTKRSEECTLYISEGGSALTMVVEGRQAVQGGHDTIGGYALQGKIMNPSNVSSAKLNANNEISNLKKMIGLRYGVDYSLPENIKTLRYGKQIRILADQDSVTLDTPVLVRSGGLVDIKCIDTLNSEPFKVVKGMEKMYAPSYFEVWTDKGWSKIKHVMKHKTYKKIYKVSTPSGIVECTEDHGLLNSECERVCPKECSFNTSLLHKKLRPIAPFKSKITMEEAYFMGLFFSNGKCNKYYIDNSVYIFFSISCTDKSTLELAKQYIEVIYNIESTEILEKMSYSSLYYELNIYTENMVHDLENYNIIFYDKKQRKKVPKIILNSSIYVMNSFLLGVFDAQNIDHNKEIKVLKFNTKLKAMGVYQLLTNCIYFCNVFSDKKDIYNITYSSLVPLKQSTFINTIREINYDEDVYDLETENHHFHAGVGHLIVHNTDGFHIAGLVFNYFYREYRALLDLGFIGFVNTPIVRVKRPRLVPLEFYSNEDFKEWKRKNSEKKYTANYYKGLATHELKEKKQIFTKPKVVNIKLLKNEEEEKSMMVSFDSSETDSRKMWMSRYEEEDVHKKVIIEGVVSLKEFNDTKLIQYHVENMTRSLPSVIDGLKESQRKILYACFLKKLYGEDKKIKVAQLGGYVSEVTDYHHGEASLYGAIIKMAQNYVGSNNINLLYPSGSFGTRLGGVKEEKRGGKVFYKVTGGGDHGAPRYIYTYLEDITRSIFVNADDHLLKRNFDDDNNPIEPFHYIPIIPMILVNGSKGIGSGWSTNIPSYNPLDIVNWIKKWLNKKECECTPLKPWWKGFKGEVKKEGDYVTTSGILEKDPKKKNVYHVNELPIGMWTNNFKTFLENLQDKKAITTFNMYNDTNNVHFEIKVGTNFIPSMKNGDFTCLTNKVRFSNMVALNSKGKAQKYKNAEEILYEFCDIRLQFYSTRKEDQLKTLKKNLIIDENKYRFIEEVAVKKTIVIFNKTEEMLFKELFDKKYEKVDDNYSYLINMKFASMTKGRLQTLTKSIETLKDKISLLTKSTPKKIWLQDLIEFEKKYKTFYNRKN